MWSWYQWVLMVSRQSPRMLMRPFMHCFRPGLASFTYSVSPGSQGKAARGSLAVVLMLS
ncbi:hypothetical protein D3C76_1507060 [compost metagenome]